MRIGARSFSKMVTRARARGYPYLFYVRLPNGKEVWRFGESRKKAEAYREVLQRCGGVMLLDYPLHRSVSVRKYLKTLVEPVVRLPHLWEEKTSYLLLAAC